MENKKMSDKEERQRVIAVMEEMLEAMKVFNSVWSSKERQQAIEYVISSIKGDLAYDLEEAR